MTKADFISAARTAARGSPFPIGVSIAQAALESAWGKSQLARDAHNYFGIKAHGSRPWIELPTREAVGGVLRRTTARFARYESMDACFADRDRILSRSPRYAQARACAADPEAFIRALARHWATDPRYAEKLLSLYRTNHLGRFDLGSPARD